MNNDVLNKHDALLQKAYIELSRLRSIGVMPNISMVAVNTGIARATINQKKEDWAEFRAAVRGKPTPKAALALVRQSEESLVIRNKLVLKDNVSKALKEVDELKTDTRRIVSKLVEQLHACIESVNEGPNNKAKQIQQKEKINELKKANNSLALQNRELKAQLGGIATVTPISEASSYIDVYSADSRSTLNYDDLFTHNIDASNKMDKYFTDSEVCPGVIYLLCGNFASGKSNIIRTHRRTTSAKPLYVDGTSHSRDIRTLFLRRARSIAPTCKIICIRVFTETDECLKRNADSDRKKRSYQVASELIKTIGDNFEEVSLVEGFDAIEIYELKR